MRWHTYEDLVGLWHHWFAWRPVLIGRQRVWLETIERRRVFIPCHPCGEYEWEYRILKG